MKGIPKVNQEGPPMSGIEKLIGGMAGLALLITGSASTSSAQIEPAPLGCWQRGSLRRIEGIGIFYVHFCFFQGGKLYGSNMHGTSGNDFEVPWQAIGINTVEIDGVRCLMRFSDDAQTLDLTTCGHFDGGWRRAERLVYPNP